MSDIFKHGVYGQIQAISSRVPNAGRSAIVYIGTAPVHMLALESGESYNVNKPVVVNNISEARQLFGYSDDWASYTLCEAMHAHLENNGVGPLVLINVLDPTKTAHKGTAGTVSKTPENGRIIIPSAESIILDSVVVKTQDDTPVVKVKGTDYSIAYSIEKKTITITELSAGALGTAALTITYDVINPAGVTSADVIGSSDGLGLNTGTFAVQNVYPLTGYIPSFLAAPGFSSIPDVHTAMYQNSQKINDHWDAYMFVDLPLINGATVLNLDTVVTYKNANGYDKPNETVYFPMALGTDGAYYHLSVLAAANFQGLLIEQDDVPYKTASNTDCPIIERLYISASDTERVYDDAIINAKLNKNGIASAAFVGGRWAIWGASSADYNQNDGDRINVAETNRMMLFYISNDFQHRRSPDVDQPMTANDLQTIVAEEQSRLDALTKMGALLYGEVFIDVSARARSDIMNGDYAFSFNVTTTPLAKSMTAIVNWTDAGFTTYFESLTA